jgi:hypothetical protein
VDLFKEKNKHCKFTDFICNKVADRFNVKVFVESVGKQIIFFNDYLGSFYNVCLFHETYGSSDVLIDGGSLKPVLSPYGNTAVFFKQNACKVARFYDNMTLRQYALKRLIENKAVGQKYIEDNEHARTLVINSAMTKQGI